MARKEIILQDFDGSRTIFPVELPLREVVRAPQSDMEVTVNKIYARSDDTDDDGRPIYREQR